MDTFIEEHHDIWGDNPASLMNDYGYHPKLTGELDNSDPKNFNREILYKMVLWKLSRFPYISDGLVEKLRSIPNIEPKRHVEAREIIEELLRTSGVALPMASTFLRFLNPKAFQIIDVRAYRVLLPSEPKYTAKPQKLTKGFIKKSIDIYFKYLDRIHEISSEKLPFESADRILYQLDIKLGNKIGRNI